MSDTVRLKIETKKQNRFAEASGHERVFSFSIITAVNPRHSGASLVLHYFLSLVTQIYGARVQAKKNESNNTCNAPP
jgi:hypothetical protein